MKSPPVLNLSEKHAQFTDTWSPKRIARLDDYEVKLAKAEGEFVWHQHDDADELFLVTKGRLRIEIEGAYSAILGPGEMTVIPKGVRHRPVVEEGPVHMLLLERAGVVNTGEAGGDLTAMVEDL